MLCHTLVAHTGIFATYTYSPYCYVLGCGRNFSLGTGNGKPAKVNPHLSNIRVARRICDITGMSIVVFVIPLYQRYRIVNLWWNEDSRVSGGR